MPRMVLFSRCTVLMPRFTRTDDPETLLDSAPFFIARNRTQGVHPDLPKLALKG